MNSACKTYFLLPLTLTAILIWTSNCNAQNNWTFIATPGSPDAITTFDLANPGGTLNQIGNVATNFNRGMDYFATDSFYYYVSTDALNNEGDRGLWSWVDGVNTQIASVEFQDGAGSDATWDEATSRFYVVVDDQDDIDGDSLYVWENIDSNPTFTEIGETGVISFIGIAIDPTDGTLYGYDSLDEILYTIDTTTGATTMIGGSGLSLASVGGMDFNADGSTLVLTAGNEVYTVDRKTGGLFLVGNVGQNTTAVAFNLFDSVCDFEGRGDVNLDGVVNLLDVDPFVDALSNGDFIQEADTNCDGVVNLLDVDSFVELLSGG